MNFRRFDLALLPPLDALLRERNVTRAAARLCVSQQALSATLRRLRLHFDDDLLVRAGRRFELTALGQSLLEPVRDALLAVQAALEARPVSNPADMIASFKIAVSDYAAIMLLPHLLARLECDAPSIRIVVQSVDGDSLHDLVAGDVDLCLESGDASLFAKTHTADVLQSSVLFEDDFVVVFDGASSRPPDPLDRNAYYALRHGIAIFEDGVKTIVER